MQVKIDIFIHNILAKFMNPNCDSYHAQTKEMDAQYAASICTFLAPVMDYIWRHGESDIQVTSAVGSKQKREVLQKSIGGATRRYGMAGHQLA